MSNDSEAQAKWVEAMLRVAPGADRKELELTAQQMSAIQPFTEQDIPQESAPSPLTRKQQIARGMDLESLIATKAEVTAQFSDVKEMLEAIDAEILLRAAEKKATVLFTDAEQIEITYTERIDYRIDVLRTLAGKIPDELFNKAVYLEQPEPVWKASATALKSLAKKCGTEVAEIVEAGMPKVRVGNPKIKITPRNVPQNVTDTVAA